MQTVQNNKVNTLTSVSETNCYAHIAKQETTEIGELLQNSSTDKKQLEEEFKRLENEQFELMEQIKKYENALNDKKAKKEYIKESSSKRVLAPFVTISSIVPAVYGMLMIAGSAIAFINREFKDGLKLLGAGSGIIAGVFAGAAAVFGIAEVIDTLVRTKKYQKTLESDIDKCYQRLEEITKEIAAITNKL